MTQQILRTASLLLLIAGSLPGTEIEVTFQGEVSFVDLPGFARGQPVSGRIVYDNAATALPGAEPPFFYLAVLSFDVRVGDTVYAMTGGPGDLTLFDGSDDDPATNYIIIHSDPGGLLGPPMSGFSPLALNLGLRARSPAVIPSLALDSIATKYSLADIVNEPGESGLGITFQSGGDVLIGAAITLTSLEARPYLPPLMPRRPPDRAIRLEDIAAGGDGSGTAPIGNVGIDPRTGAFTTTYFDGVISDTDGVNPSPVPDSPYIDSVFLMKGKVPTAEDGCGGCFVQYTTQSGVQLWVDDSEETNTSWNYILKNRVGGISVPGIRVGDFDFFETSIGLHASQGITFDLDELRARHGDEAVGCFSAYWGMDDCGTGLVRLYAMVSNDTEGVTDILNGTYGPGQGQPISIAIPRSAQYLTLASASVNGNAECDRGTIARPVITPLPCPSFSDGWISRILPTRVSPGGEDILIEGEALYDGYSIYIGGPGLPGFDLPDQVYYDDTLRGARVPAVPPGVYDVLVRFGGITIDYFPGALEVAPLPVISSVSPDLVLTDRLVKCRFIGQSLRPDMEVLVPNSDQGAERLLHQEFISPELITGYIPRPIPPRAAIAGTDIVLLIDQTRTHGFPVQILYVEVGIEKVVPDLVSTAGGTVVTIEGLGFEPDTTFLIGTSPLLDIEIIDSAHARGKTLPLAPGWHTATMILNNVDPEVLITVPNMVQALATTSPNITGVVPLTVSARGGDIVAISTDAWHGGATPRIGGAALGNLDATQPMLLRGESPPLAPGLHAVDLIGLDGLVISRIEGAIEAVNPVGITLASVSPFEVAAGGGTPMTFTGAGFEPGLEPRLGGLPLTQVEIVDGESLRGLSPPLPEGPHAATLTEGNAERARFPEAVLALPLVVGTAPVVGRPAAARFAAGIDRIAIAATDVPAGAVLRVGGVPVIQAAPSSPCGVIGGEGGGAGIAGGGAHAVFEGIIPALPPGRYAVDFYLAGQGVLATLEEAVEVVAADAPPRASHVVSADVLADGSTRLHIFGSCFAEDTRFVLGGKPIADAAIISPRLAIGHAPALDPAEMPGPRTLELLDPRGNTSLESAVVYVKPDSGTTFIRGDANQSGSVDLSDAVTILGYLFLGNPQTLDCLETADIDESGKIEISDPIQLLGHLFLGGRPPRAPYPACGEGSAASTQGCESFARCGGGGNAGGRGGVAQLRANVFVLEEERTSPGEPILRDVSPVSREVIIDDPPGGLDLEPGDIIAGYVPATSDAIHESLTYLVKLEGEGPRSCLATAPGDRTYLASPATLVETFSDAEIELKVPNSAADLRISSEAVTATGNTLCSLAEEAGGAGAERGGGGTFFDPLLDVDFRGISVFSWQDGPNWINVGFHRLRVLYAASQASLGVGISGLGVTGVSFFSGILLDSEIEMYLDTHFEEHIKKEKKLLALRKDHVVVVFGVPIHFAATGDLYAGVDLDAQVNLYVAAGAKARFQAGTGFRFDGDRIHNLSGIEPPVLESIPGTPELNLNGSLVAKGYVRPETHLFAGILFRGLTADLGTRSEAFLRFHAAGETQPVPCFQWGIDAGMKVTLIPEIQLFGKDLFDQTFDVIDHEELNLLGDQYGCKAPPVPSVSYYLVPLGGERYEVRLDASASRDPDGGSLRYRWDFDADGQCDLATLSDPRAKVVMEHVCPTLFQTELFKNCVRGREMILRVTDDEDVSVEHRFKIVLR